MTIYSQHPNGEKVQILATYRTADSVASVTVASVGTSATAGPIVDALNRVSACATVPVSVFDHRDYKIREYPTDHLDALTDRAARKSLLRGAYSLWYEQAMWLLNEALKDLDTALSSVPVSVRAAVKAELRTEARQLRSALAEYTEDNRRPNSHARREWDVNQPFVPYDGGIPELSAHTRETLDRLEAKYVDGHGDLSRAADDMRLLLDVHARCRNDAARYQTGFLTITVEPRECQPYFIEIQSPLPNGRLDRTQWHIDICRWKVDERDDDGNPERSHGETVLRCALPTRPKRADLVALLDRRNGVRHDLAAWAGTHVGEPLGPTAFLVTQRFDNANQREVAVR